MKAMMAEESIRCPRPSCAGHDNLETVAVRMPRYKLFYLHDSHVEKFRGSPPKPKPYGLKDRDYEHVGEVDAPGPYAVWKQLQERSDGQPGSRTLGVGDVLESEESTLLVLNHWGFDEAAWQSAETVEEAAEPEAALAVPAGTEAR